MQKREEAFDVRALREGNQVVFNKIFNAYYHRLRLFAVSYVRDEFTAEDIVNESLATLWEKRQELEDHTNIPALLLTIVKNKALNIISRDQMKHSVQGEMQDITMRELQLRIADLQACDPEEIFVSEVRTIVDGTLQRVSTQTRHVFILSRYNGKSNKEIAEMLNITTKGVEFHISKVLKMLRVSLKDYLCVILLLFFSK